jgi:uncharacterized membrane protein
MHQPKEAKLSVPRVSGPKPREVALAAVMTAATAAVTMVISIPFPPTRGYFNLGDAMVMLAGLLFGARLGGVAGGVGSAVSDILLGYGYFAPLTLFIKGTEGFLTGLIGNSRRFALKVAGVVAGAVAMLAGYFSVETPLYGFGAAFAELVSINSIQVLSGAIISLTLAQIIFRTYPDVRFLQLKPEGARTGILTVVVAVVLLSAIVGVYLATGVSP